MFMAAAIAGALSERGLVEPRSVAAWARFFADADVLNVSQDVKAAIASQLGSFADLLEQMATRPEGAGRA
jgi:hypothetical protein